MQSKNFHRFYNVQFCKESTIRFASWLDESAKTNGLADRQNRVRFLSVKKKEFGSGPSRLQILGPDHYGLTHCFIFVDMKVGMIIPHEICCYCYGQLESLSLFLQGVFKVFKDLS